MNDRRLIRIALAVAVIGLGAGIALGQKAEGDTPHIVVIAGDNEYGSRDSMGVFANDLRTKFGFQVTVLESMVGELENADNPDKSIPGLEVIDQADLLVIYVRMRVPPQEQLDRLDAYFESGKPAIGLRTTTHGFTNDRGWAPRYFGGHYWRHQGGETDTFVLPSAENHPIMRGVSRHETNGSSMYVTNPLSETAEALVMGRSNDTAPPQPFAWVNEYVEGSRQFFLAAGHPEDIALRGNQEMLFNAVFWSLGRDVPANGVLSLSGAASATPDVDYPAPPALDAPEDATVLFDGTDLSDWDITFGAKEPRVFEIDGRAHSGEGLQEFSGPRWDVRGGYVEATPGRGDIVSRELFADIELQLDVLIPESAEGVQRIWKGNSGVYLNGRYEIQVLDSESEAAIDENSHGAINGYAVPDVLASKAAGEWQRLHVYFRAARFVFGRKTDAARMTVRLNGELIHDNVEVERPTPWGLPEIGVDDGSLTGPVRLQADSAGVRFANVWARNLSPDEVAEQLPSPPQLTGEAWADIDFGPSKKFSLQVSENNIAYKGLAVRLDPGLGGISSGTEFMIFDTDTLRWAGGWTGSGFCDWRGIAMNGQHEIHPSIVGELWFTNPVLPGWGQPGDGSFEDERVLGRDNLRYGPLDREWGHWKGHYIHDDKVVLSYTIGETDVLEMASAVGPAGNRAMVRTLDLGPRKQPLTLQVAREANATLSQSNIGGIQTARFEYPEEDAVSRARLAFRGSTNLETPDLDVDYNDDFSVYARIKTNEAGTIFAYAPQSGPWAESARALYVREGHIVFDVGWVGEMVSRRAVNDDEFHDVVATYDSEEHDVRLYIDGRLNGKKTLEPGDETEDFITKIGFASSDFPENSYFDGLITDVRVYDRRLSSRAVAELSETEVGRGVVGRWVTAEQRVDVIPDSSGNGNDARIVHSGTVSGLETVAAFRGGGNGAAFMDPEDESGATDLRLTIPAGADPVRLEIFIARVSGDESPEAFAEIVRTAEPMEDLSAYTTGGPAHWTEKLVTQGERGDGDGAYVVDTITHPVDNPYRSWLRFGGFDFFEDDSRAAICTWDGDVWLVDGINESLDKITWQRIASGMFQPLGVAIVDEEIYVICRDQITVLRDLNGDGETDFYENFNNDHQVTEHFHEFALDLKFSAVDGNFYYTKGGRHGADAITPNHGTLIRVSRDGKKSEFVANGFRAPNGLGIGPAGEMLTADNQGHWIPANRINWVKPGGFYGYMWGYHDREVSDGFDEPLCWIHPEIDRSPGTFVWVPDYRWGPLRGHVITVSYGMGQIFNVLNEEIDGVRQGGVVRFPLEFDTGVTRAKFRKRDGQLYLAGLFGWAGNKTQPGGFYRVRYTGQNVYMPEALHIASDGVTLTFTDPLDAESATDPGNYGVSHWNYKWQQQYGSEDYKMDGTQGRDDLQVASVALSTDKRTVYLEIPGIRPVMQMQILVNLKAADGAEVRHNVHHTIHVLGSRSVRDLSGTTVATGKREPVEKPEATVKGLAQTIVSKGSGEEDTRSSRLAALYVADGETPSPFVPKGPFTSTWTGYIDADLNERFRFSVEGNGTATFTVNGTPALDGTDIELRQGLNPVEAVYDSPPQGSSEFRLYWESSQLVREPVPPSVFFRPASIPKLDEGDRNRAARSLVAEYRCLRCHTPEPGALDYGMPELRADAPALDRVGEKYMKMWLIDRILDPDAHHADARMPQVLHDSEPEQKMMASSIADYLRSLSRPEEPVKATAKSVETGKTLYNQLGCFACHRLPGEESIAGESGRISFDGLQNKWHASGLVDYLHAPHRDYAHNPMPDFQLSEEEAQAIAHYVLDAVGPPQTIRTNEWQSDNGRELIEQRGCLNCHTLEGHTSTLTASPLAKLREADMGWGCLAEKNEKFANAPRFDLSVDDRRVLRSFLAENSDSLARFDPAEYAERQIRALKCTACHARDGEGDRWAMIAPEKEPETVADDPFGEEELETIHIQRPHLNFAGEKLHSEWVKKLLEGSLDYKPRPGLAARMPVFPAEAENMARGLAAQHGFPSEEVDESPIDSDLAAVGQKLALSENLFRCNTCHGVGGDEPLAGADTETINFAHIPERLRRSYFDRFTRDPQRILPGTQMPQYVTDDGKSTVPDILSADVDQQFDAIWQFMRSLGTQQ
jgi:mono/diheme cytochrome c family protein